jgi:hypothetical protein
MDRIRKRSPGRDSRQSGRPPARQQEKPPPDRPLDPGQAKVWPKARRREAVGPMAADRIRQNPVGCWRAAAWVLPDRLGGIG